MAGAGAAGRLDMCGIGCCLCGSAEAAQARASQVERCLAARGPDFQATKSALASRLQLVGAVLHMRGQQLCQQPVCDDDGNVLLWNGEIFGGLPVGEAQSDTAMLSAELRACGTKAAVLQLIERVHGPFAFIYWQASTSTLFFGRDRFGRRSLLINRPDRERIENEFLLCSAAPETSECEWREVDLGGVYTLTGFEGLSAGDAAASRTIGGLHDVVEFHEVRRPPLLCPNRSTLTPPGLHFCSGRRMSSDSPHTSLRAASS